MRNPIMLADAGIYNSATIQRLLLWGIRQKKAVWTFSANLAKAGAFAGLSADSRAIAEQTAQLVQQVLAGAEVSKLGLQYPAQVDSAVNQRTAEMIGISLPGELLEQVTVRFGEDR